MNRSQNGFSLLIVPIIFIILIAVSFVTFLVWQGNRSTYRAIDETDVPKIKHPGLDLAEYDPEVMRAGDVVFWDDTQTLGQLNVPFIEFGYTIPANSVGPAKVNPQPTFVTIPEAKVYSLIDGEVIKVEEIYSGDYTIHVAESKFSPYIFETEHVINPRVQVGDRVTAGQHIAQASTYDANNFNGNGIVEFGILLKGKPPAHLCPYTYLDDNIRDEVYTFLRSIYSSWNETPGQEIYNEDLPVPGCVTTEAVYEVE